MKKIFIVIVSMFFSLQAIGQSSYYYDKGAYLASGTSAPQWWSRAYNYWVTGEQKGEIKSAKMLIYCLLADKGTPRNLTAAIQKIDKWYKKDPDICYLGALLFTPLDFRQYTYFSDVWLSYSLGAGVSKDVDFSSIKKDINKALKYINYALENFVDLDKNYNLTYNGIKGSCYEFGLGGYKQDYKEATKYYMKSQDPNQYQRYTPVIKLLQSSSSMTEFIEIVKLFLGKDNLCSYLMGLQSKNNYYEHMKMVVIKRDEFLDHFWSLSPIEMELEYNGCSIDVKKMYDESFYDKFCLFTKEDNSLAFYNDPLAPSTNLSLDNIKDLVKIIDNYPNKEIVNAVRKKYTNHYSYHLEQNIEHLYIEPIELVNETQKYDSLVSLQFIDYPENWHQIKLSVSNRFLVKLEDLKKDLLENTRQYIQSRIYDMEHPGYAQPNSYGISSVYVGYVGKKNPIVGNLCVQMKQNLLAFQRYDSIQYRNENKMSTYKNLLEEVTLLTNAMGFYINEEKYEYKPDIENSSRYNTFLEKYPNSEYSEYAKIKFKTLLSQEQDLAAFNKAFALKTTSPKSEIKNVLSMPVSQKMSALIEYMCKKRQLKCMNNISQWEEKPNLSICY